MRTSNISDPAVTRGLPPNRNSARPLVIGALLFGLIASFFLTDASGRDRVLLDSGWRFQSGDPADVTTNVTWYPEISDLAKLETNEIGAGTNTETYMESIRVDFFAAHAGENVSFVQTNYDDSAWRQLNLPHDWAVELPFNSSADGGHATSRWAISVLPQTTSAGIATRLLCLQIIQARRCGCKCRRLPIPFLSAGGWSAFAVVSVIPCL